MFMEYKYIEEIEMQAKLLRTMNKGVLLGAMALALNSWSGTALAGAEDGFTAKLNGKNLVPSVYTPAYGKFKAKVGPYGKFIFYKMYY